MHAARHDVGPLGEVPAILIKHLDSLVNTVTDEEPAPRIEGKTMGFIELTGSGALLAPLHKKFSIARVLHDSVVSMAVCDKNVTVRGYCNICWTAERIRSISRNTWGAERHEHSAVGAELQDLLTLSFPAARIRRPDVSIRIQEEAVGPHEHSFTPAIDQLSIRVVFQERWYFISPNTVTCKTPLEDQKVAPGINFYADGLPPGFNSFRQLCPSLDQTIRHFLDLVFAAGD
jgi:hypothetical protein